MSNLPERTKWALLIGINTYPNLTKFEQLEGCVNDVHLMAGILQGVFGFPEDQIFVLTDEAATRDGILEAMEALAERIGRDDIVVMQYSGHGSQMTDREGDEPDGLDETLVTYDSARAPGENRDITDDEIYAWLQRVTAQTPYVTLIFDCCHSGTLARDAFGAKARSIPPDTRPIDELPPSPVTGPTTRSAAASKGPSGWLPLGQRYVLLAGCRDDECSYEYRDPEADVPHGALSFFLGQALANARSGTTYRDVFEAARGPVRANSSKQTLQIEGALDRELFGVRDIEPMRFVSVRSRTGDAVELAAGAAHGLTVGSEWAIYPTDAKTDDEALCVGRVAVTGVGAISSTARILEEQSPEAITEGNRAVEAAHAVGDLRLRVALRGDDREALAHLQEALEASPLLHVVEDGGTAEVCVYYLAPRSAVRDADPVPQLGPLATQTWAAVGTDGRLVMPPRAASEAGAASTLRDNLETITRYRRALALLNPDPASVLKQAVEVQLKRRAADGTWLAAEPDTAGGDIVYEEGDRLGLTLTNRHTAPVYVHILDFGLTGRVGLLYPIAGANEPLAPGATLEVGIRAGDELELGFPEAFPFVTEPGEAAPVEGIETLKVLVTSKPADFSPLMQEGVRSVNVDDSPLGALLSLALTGRSTRDLSRPQPPAPDEDWAAVTRSFILRRPASAESSAATTPLDAEGRALTLNGVTLRTPGVSGRVRVIPVEAARTRSLEQPASPFGAVFDRAHLQPQQTIEIEAVSTRSLAEGTPVIEVVVPDPGEDTGQCVLYTDEGGVTTWQFEDRDRPKTRGMATRTYVIDRAEPAPMGQPKTRGLVGTLGKKILQVLAFPLMDPLVGRISETFAARWEAKHRPYRLRSFTPDDYHTPDAPALEADDWARLSEGRALLFIHGTFLSSHASFCDLPPEVLADLHRQYEGRVFAFDHFTLSDDPKTNVKWFLDHLPDGAALDLDLICHSRGGLVGRVLAEQQQAFSLGARSLRLGTLAFVAAPNNGTALADPKHLSSLVDTYTNLLALIPDNVVTDVLDTVVAVVKQLAVGALKGLDGLQAMKPDSEFQEWINGSEAPDGTRYCALAATYTPTDPGLRAWVTSRLTKAIFGNENDLVVPTSSVYEANGAGAFPIEERRVFDADAAIAHTGFFAHPEVQEQLLAWFTD